MGDYSYFDPSGWEGSIYGGVNDPFWYTGGTPYSYTGPTASDIWTSSQISENGLGGYNPQLDWETPLGTPEARTPYAPQSSGSLLDVLSKVAKLALGLGGIGATAAKAGQGSTGSKDIVSSPGNTLAYNYAKNYKPSGTYSISPYLLDQGGDIAGQMMQQAMGTTPEQQFLRNMLFKSSTITPHALGYDPREEEMINLTRQYYAQLGEDIDRDKFATGTGNRGIDEQQYLDAVAGQKSEELKAIMQAIAQERELKKYYDTLAQTERSKAPSSMLDMLAKQQAAVAPWKTAGVGTEESNAQLQAIRDALMLKLITATQGTGTQTTVKGEREGTGTDVLSTILASMLVPEKNAATGETAPSGYNLLFGDNGILGLLGLV